MGKRQHQSDKLYVTSKEWAEFFGGHKKTKNNSAFRRLPFFCCSISLQPVENPYCSKEGHVFDESNILPWLLRYKTNPITGKKMKMADMFKLKFHKNNDGKYHCPVLFKTFNQNSHIVAIATTGNVFSNEAVEQLNIKTKNWKDLITDVKFVRTDIVVIQDPSNLSKFNMQTFFHLKHNQKLPDEELRERSDPKYYLKSTNAETSETLKELYETYQGDEMLKRPEPPKKVKIDKYNASCSTTGTVAAAFTSTCQTPQTVSEIQARDEDEVRYGFVKTKGYVQLKTNMGNINIELHCDITPKTCENFIGLCKKGYYKNTTFHRLIKNFMIQGGDPTGKGTGGKSLWGESFKDEFHFKLAHNERGILSMANSGPNTNKSQFFITLKSCKHLDKKHTVFGKVVGGMSTLLNFEQISTDKNDRPKKMIIIEGTEVFVDPYEAADKELADLRAKEAEKEEEKAKEEAKKAASKPKVFGSGIGKYINPANTKSALKTSNEFTQAPRKKKLTTTGFSDFSGW